ncbi:Transposase [Alteromonadaceae bacterium Bs31]|nr:Transposase [Alteromonadaceae bacterium Bs31]
MSLYCGIDLHSNNSVICVINDNDKRLKEVKIDNNIDLVIKALSRYKKRLKAIAVESTFNWYWLVDGLHDAGFKVLLVNTAKVVQYEGLKRTDDRYDAFHLAHLLRLGILPTGYIYPKQERSLRDLLRKRMQIVQDRSRDIIRLKSFYQLHTGETLRADKIKAKKYTIPTIGDDNTQLNIQVTTQLIRSATEQIKVLEKNIACQLVGSADLINLKTVPGIGDILGETILLETGDIKRFGKPGNYSSYARCVDSRRLSNGKIKGRNNRKNGNRYLAWAFIEAANFAIRRSDKAKAFYTRKAKEASSIVARKALAQKLATAKPLIH